MRVRRRRGVEICQAHAAVGQLIQIRRWNLAAERSQIGITHVIGDDQENVRARVRGGSRFQGLGVGAAHVATRHAGGKDDYG